MLPLLRSEAVGGEADCDIMRIREVIVRVCPVFNNNAVSKERAIMELIKNIHNRSGPQGLCVLIGKVLELSGVGAIRHYRTETRDKGHIREHSHCSTRLVQKRCFAFRELVKAAYGPV